jgi:hypothetical protein
MNNKKVLEKYPTAIAVEYQTKFDVGFVGKGQKFYIIQDREDSEYALGFGRTEKAAWEMATIWLKNDMSMFPDYKGYPIEEAKLEME